MEPARHFLTVPEPIHSQSRSAVRLRDRTVRELMKHIAASTGFFADAVECGAVAEDRAWPKCPSEELLPAYRHRSGRLVAAFGVAGVMDGPLAGMAGRPTAAFCP